MHIRQFICFALLSCVLGVANAETLELRNGDRLTGTLVRIGTDTLVWRSAILGELVVPIDAIAMVNGEALPVRTPPATPAGITAPEDGQTAKFIGEFDFGFEKDAGTSDTEEVDVRLRTSYERGRVVGALRLEHESEAQRGNSTSEDYEIEIKAERFSRTSRSGPYWYVQAGWNKDRFRTIESWTTLGTGPGYAWQSGERTRIKLEGGFDGWLIAGPEGQETTTGGRVVLDMRHSLPSLASVMLFSEAQFLWELGGRQNQLIETSSGIRIPLNNRFYAQVSFDYDRFDFVDAPEFAENDETEWNFRLGANWD
ncbi:MAG: DUF481 domain-containing protein [Woeseiaceae bacterium]|nr:DUF481 domain-containing protein [Woeseiaceae bacterium]